MYIGLRTIGLCALLGACAASGPFVEAVGAGPDLTQGATFSVDFARTAAGPEARAAATGAVADAAIPDLVSRRLAEKGMVAAPAGRYLAEVAYSSRPSVTGAYAEAGAPEQPTWLNAPKPLRQRRAGRQTCTFALRLTVAATGAEVFRASVAQEVGKAGCEAATASLLDTALAALPVQRAVAAN